MSAAWDERQRAMLAEMGFRLPPAPRAPLIEAEAPPLPAPSVVAAPPPLIGVPARAPGSPSGFEGLSLPALREAVSACRGCGLCEQRRQAVFGAGALQQAQWLVVTDPVDEADDSAGEALGGDAGRLLIFGAVTGRVHEVTIPTLLSATWPVDSHAAAIAPPATSVWGKSADYNPRTRTITLLTAGLASSAPDTVTVYRPRGT